MGRVADALMRAAAQVSGSEKPPAERHAEEAETLFVSAWDLERLTAKRSSAAVHPVNGNALAGPTPAPAADGPSAATPAAVGNLAPSVRLESQLAMGWPHPFAAEVSEKFVVMRETSAAAVRQYRRLGVALLQVQLERGVKTVMVASAVAGEGRTLTAANLALTLSEIHRKRVLLIDTALRQPRIHQLFQVSAGAGLSICLDSATRQGLPVVELTRRLTLLPGGRAAADPEGLLGSDRMREVLAEASASYDWVILDTAPVVPLPDARLLARLVDVAVLVIEAGKTPRRLIEDAVEALGRDRLLGVVLNRAADSAVAAAAGPERT